MPKRRKKKSMSKKKSVGLIANKTFLAAIVGIIIIGGGIAAFYMMPSQDTATWDTATEIIRDRGGTTGVPSAPDETDTTDVTDEVPVDEYIYTNPIQMNLFGIDIDGVRHPVPAPSTVAQSAFLGDIEIFDVEFDIYYNIINDVIEYPERYTSDVEIMIMLSLVDRSVMDTHGNAYRDSCDSGMVYPDEFTYNHTILTADIISAGSGFITLSLVNDLYGSFMFTDINDIDDAALVDARTVGLVNQLLEPDNVTITELTGMLTFEYGILGYYMVNELGSGANRALKRLAVTTDPVISDEVGGMSVYDIGGVGIADTTILVVGLGVFGMIMVYYYLSRRR